MHFQGGWGVIYSSCHTHQANCCDGLYSPPSLPQKFLLQPWQCLVHCSPLVFLWSITFCTECLACCLGYWYPMLWYQGTGDSSFLLMWTLGMSSDGSSSWVHPQGRSELSSWFSALAWLSPACAECLYGSELPDGNSLCFWSQLKFKKILITFSVSPFPN